MHVLAFNADVQASPQGGLEVVELAGNAEYRLFDGIGHCSIYRHAQDTMNAYIKELIERYL